MLSNYEKAVELIKSHKELISFRSTCSEETVRKAEIMLGVKFPRDYAEHLKNFGGVDFGGTRICGIGFNDLSRSDMITWTLDERNNCGMPKNLIIIHELGYGTRDCLQINENNPDKSPVVEYHDPDSPVRVLAPDFGTFLLDLVQEEIKYQEEEKQKEAPQEPQQKMVQDELF